MRGDVPVSNPHPVDFRPKFQIQSTSHFTIKNFFVGPKSSGSGALQKNTRYRTINYSKLQAMREPWSTEECPGRTKADYKKPIIAIDEKIKKKKQKSSVSFTSSYSEEKLTFLSIVSLLKNKEQMSPKFFSLGRTVTAELDSSQERPLDA